MTRKGRVRAGLLFFMVLVPGVFLGGLDFYQAVQMGLQSSSALQYEYASWALREGAWQIGIRSFFPRLSISASQEDRLSMIGPDSFQKNYSISIDQLLWDGGRLSLSRRLERAELDLAGSSLQQLAGEMAETVLAAYREVIQGRSLLEIHENSMYSLEEQMSILHREAELGLIRPSDLLEAEITLAMTELEILSLAMNVDEAEWGLARLLGIKDLPPLTEKIDTQRSPTLPALSIAQALAESRNPELAMIRYAILRRQAESRAASLSWIPTLRLTGTAGLSGRTYPLSRYSWSVGLSIDFSSPWVAGGTGFSYGRDPPYDSNARLQQSLSPAPNPAEAFNARTAALALRAEYTRYERALEEAFLAAERALRICELRERRRVLAFSSLRLEEDKYQLAELKLSLGEITRLELMEARLNLAKVEAALVDAAVAVLQAERDLERLLDFGPGELSSFLKDSI